MRGGGATSFIEMVAFESVKPFIPTAFFLPTVLGIAEQKNKPHTSTRWDSALPSVEDISLGHPLLKQQVDLEVTACHSSGLSFGASWH